MTLTRNPPVVPERVPGLWGVAFVVTALLAFYALVYGMPVDGIMFPLVRSVALICYAALFYYLQQRFIPFEPTLTERPIAIQRVAMWGFVCFVFNLLLVGGTFYIFFRGLVNGANHGFDIQRFNSKPVMLKTLMAFAAALSEEVVYRRILFRYLLGFKLYKPVRYGLAFVASSLIFGFGHFHAGLEKCLVASVSGLVFAGFYFRTRSIWVVVIGHFLGDAFAFMI